MKPAAAVAISALNTFLNTANTLLSIWIVTSAAPTNIAPSASVGEVLLSSPGLAAGVSLFAVGIATELFSEFQRKWFKSRPENKGKPYGGGLWSLATNINYGGYTLWRTGYALAAAGPAWGLAVGGFSAYDFASRAIPVLDRYCTDKVRSFEDSRNTSVCRANRCVLCSMASRGSRSSNVHPTSFCLYCIDNCKSLSSVVLAIVLSQLIPLSWRMSWLDTPAMPRKIISALEH